METLRMSWEERRRLEIFSQVSAGKVSLQRAAELLEISYRQARRVLARYESAGDAGLVHGLRGQPSNRRSDPAFRARVLERSREAYGGFGPTLAAEYLRDEGLEVGAETLRRWWREEGLGAPGRRRAAHRRRRARRARFGELVQMDGSHHDWFEGRRGWAVLMVLIDDATGRIYARFHEAESFEAAAETFRRYAERQGLPQELYVDRAGIYRNDREPTEAEILANQQPETQFGRAMRELGVKLILAHSPQAKGRVERMNGTLQDRLVKALRWEGICDLAAANEYLEKEYLGPFNAQFGKPAAEAGDLHRRARAGEDLPLILAFQEDRVVRNDWTVRWRNGYLQLPAGSGVQPGQAVRVCQQQDGRVRLFAGERELPWGPVRTTPERKRQRPRKGRPTGSAQGRRPAANHPWRGRGGVAGRPAGVG